MCQSVDEMVETVQLHNSSIGLDVYLIGLQNALVLTVKDLKIQIYVEFIAKNFTCRSPSSEAVTKSPLFMNEHELIF